MKSLKFDLSMKILGGMILFGIFLFFTSSCLSEKNMVEGYINPGAERSFEWVKDKEGIFGFVPYKTVEVELLSGEKVIAEISNHHSTPYIEYKDYPDARGKRIFVFLDNREGKYTITAGKIEK